MDELTRVTRIIVRYCRRRGIQVAPYAGGRSFDVMAERWRTVKNQRVYDGMIWSKRHMRDIYHRPAWVAKSMRAEIVQAFNNG